MILSKSSLWTSESIGVTYRGINEELLTRAWVAQRHHWEAHLGMGGSSLKLHYY